MLSLFKRCGRVKVYKDTAIEKAERLVTFLTEANKLAEIFCK